MRKHRTECVGEMERRTSRGQDLRGLCESKGGQDALVSVVSICGGSDERKKLRHRSSFSPRCDRDRDRDGDTGRVSRQGS